jgi:hypothetical protein
VSKEYHHAAQVAQNHADCTTKNDEFVVLRRGILKKDSREAVPMRGRPLLGRSLEAVDISTLNIEGQTTE